MKFNFLFVTNKTDFIVKKVKELTDEQVRGLRDSVDIFKDVLDEYYTKLYDNRHKISMEYLRAYYDTLKYDTEHRDLVLDTLWEKLTYNDWLDNKIGKYYSNNRVWIYDYYILLRSAGLLQTYFWSDFTPKRRKLGTIDKYDTSRDIETMYLRYYEEKEKYIKAVEKVESLR